MVNEFVCLVQRHLSGQPPTPLDPLFPLYVGLLAVWPAGVMEMPADPTLLRGPRSG